MQALRILIPTTLFSVVCCVVIYAVDPSMIMSGERFPYNIAVGVETFLVLELIFLLLVWPYGYKKAAHELKTKDYACANCHTPLKNTIFQKNYILRNIFKIIIFKGRATFICVKCGTK